MTTIPDSIKATLDAQWTGAGGAEPAYYVMEDYRNWPPDGEDWVAILVWTLVTDIVPVNDTYSNRTHRIELLVNTAELTAATKKADRQKELADEVVRILNATTIGDMNWQKVTEREDVSHRVKNTFRERIVVTMKEILASSASAYGTGATGDFAVVGDLTVGGDSTLDGTVKNPTDNSGFHTGAGDDGRFYHDGSDTRLVTSTGNLQLEDGTDTVTLTNIADLLMFGSANAAYVPCIYETSTGDSKFGAWGGVIRNLAVGGTIYGSWRLPEPTNKGGLKLYITKLQVTLDDADATDYLDKVYVYGSAQAVTEEYNNTSNRTAAGTYTYTFPAAIDCSGYKAMSVLLQVVSATAAEIDISNVLLECYYAA